MLSVFNFAGLRQQTVLMDCVATLDFVSEDFDTRM
jgi:hypothetical protein